MTDEEREQKKAAKRAYAKEYREKNKEKCRAACRAYYAKHRLRDQYREFYRLYGSKAPRRCVIFMKWEMAGQLCYICGRHLPFDDIHADHVVPITKGGTNDIKNLMPTHSKCNKNKSDRLDYPVNRTDLIDMVIHLEAHSRSPKKRRAA